MFFEESTPEIEAWVLERLRWMLEGRISHAVAGMTRMATVRGLSAEDREPVDKAAKTARQRLPACHEDDRERWEEAARLLEQRCWVSGP